MNSRHSLASNIEHVFRSRPNTWISMRELAAMGGIGGWRTRVSEVRRFKSMHIEHNGKNGSRSAYRFIPPAQDFELSA